MRFSAAVAASALAAGVSASYNYTAPAVYTTEVVTQYTTYCPEATEITHNGVTYTATSETTLTITNCPCTVTYPVTSSVVTSCSTCTPAATPPTTPPAPTYASPTTYAPPAPYNNSTSVYTPSTAAPSSYVPPPPTGSPVPTNAANKAVVGSGAGLAAIFGFVAYVL